MLRDSHLDKEEALGTRLIVDCRYITKGPGPVVQKANPFDNRNLYPADRAIDFRYTYSIYSNLSGGLRNPTFEQPVPGIEQSATSSPGLFPKALGTRLEQSSPPVG